MENVHQRRITILVGCHKILSIIDFHNALKCKPVIHYYCHHHHNYHHHHSHHHRHSDDEVAKETEMQDALPTGQESRDLQEMRAAAAEMQLLRASKLLLRNLQMKLLRASKVLLRNLQDEIFTSF